MATTPEGQPSAAEETFVQADALPAPMNTALDSPITDAYVLEAEYLIAHRQVMRKNAVRRPSHKPAQKRKMATDDPAVMRSAQLHSEELEPTPRRATMRLLSIDTQLQANVQSKEHPPRPIEHGQLPSVLGVAAQKDRCIRAAGSIILPHTNDQPEQVDTLASHLRGDIIPAFAEGTVMRAHEEHTILKVLNKDELNSWSEAVALTAGLQLNYLLIRRSSSRDADRAFLNGYRIGFSNEFGVAVINLLLKNYMQPPYSLQEAIERDDFGRGLIEPRKEPLERSLHRVLTTLNREEMISYAPQTNDTVPLIRLRPIHIIDNDRVK